MARKQATVTAPTVAPTVTNGNPAVTAPTVAASSASVANLVAWLATNPAPQGARKAPPAPHTVAGMLLALLASGPANMAMCAMAVANAPSTGKAHNLAPLVRFMQTKWGYQFGTHPCPTTGQPMLVLVAKPAHG